MTAPDVARRPLEGRYRSLFVLGRGGMGSVEAALQTGARAGDPDATEAGCDRVVALKRLLPDAARDRRRVDMFLREARLATMLEHPNIVRAWDFGELDGELYLAMEFVEGQSLARLLRAVRESGETLAVPVVAWLVAEICAGLHAAHELTDATGQPLHLVHRDVSPQNVIIGYDGRVKILDFGIAKIETESVTKTGEVKGKTAYMSPEQAMGDPLDRRSDLFGVGAVLYECLALKRMWGEGTDMEMIRKLALEEPPSLASTGRDLPPELVTLHAKLVARRAGDRPVSARDVADALRPFADAAAAEAVRGLVARHFATDRREEEGRLSAALHDVPPAQADLLPESVLPTTAEPTALEPRPSPTAGGKRVAWLVTLAAALGLAAYGYRTRNAGRREPPVREPTATIAAPIVREPAATTAASAPSAMPARPERSAVPTAPSVRPVMRALPVVTTARPATAMPGPVPSAVPRSPPKPPDVDEHPF